MKKINSYLAACKLLKLNPKKLPIVRHLPKRHAQATLAQFQLWTIADAIRDGKDVDNSDTNVPKYFARFYWKQTKQGPRLVFYLVNRWYSYSDVGSRLCFHTYEQAEYFGKKFIKLHEKVHRIG